MTDKQSALATDLQRLTRKWEAITDVPEEPTSTMNVIEYGLGKQQRAEVYINRLLCYLLDPNAPHGMDGEFLTAFLQGLPDTVEFIEDTYDVSNTRVNEQVTIESEDSRGYADLVIDSPGEWFLLIELKFSAEETGTTFYANASTIGEEPVAEYESGQYYLYVHQRDEPQASSETFTNWTWQAFIDDVLADFLADSAPRYPQRTAVQLHDLKDDIETIANMSEKHTADQEKIALYLDHIEAIEDVTAAFDDAWESYSEQWDSKLAARATDRSAAVQDHLGEEYPELHISRQDADDERWILRANGGDWQHLHRFGWYKHADTLESLTTRASDRNDLRIGFYFRMETHRDEAVRDHTLQFNFRNMGSNPTEFKNLYEDAFYNREAEIERQLTGTNASLTGNKLTTIEATYDIPATRYEDFFDAYTVALTDAFSELVVENPKLIRILAETFDTAVAEYR